MDAELASPRATDAGNQSVYEHTTAALAFGRYVPGD